MLARRRITTVVLAAVVLTLATPAAGNAETRTGSAIVPERTREDTSASFPGIERIVVSFDTDSAELLLHVMLRSALADPQQTRALRSTYVDFALADAWGGDIGGAECDWGIFGERFRLHLGDGVALLERGDLFDAADDAQFPLNVSPDRRTVELHVSPQPETRNLQPICFSASMSAPGEAFDGPQEWIDDTLLDGFSGLDGPIGEQASEGLLASIRYFHNEFVRRSRDTIYNVPGATSSCTPRRGAAYVRCRASSSIRSLPGWPRLSLRGWREYRLVSSRDPIVGSRLSWNQRIVATLRWRRCIRAVSVSAARGRRSCAIRVRARAGDEIRDVLMQRLRRSTALRSARP